jgi:hypothetical protein
VKMRDGRVEDDGRGGVRAASEEATPSGVQ